MSYLSGYKEEYNNLYRNDRPLDGPSIELLSITNQILILCEEDNWLGKEFQKIFYHKDKINVILEKAKCKPYDSYCEMNTSIYGPHNANNSKDFSFRLRMIHDAILLDRKNKDLDLTTKLLKDAEFQIQEKQWQVALRRLNEAIIYCPPPEHATTFPDIQSMKPDTPELPDDVIKALFDNGLTSEALWMRSRVLMKLKKFHLVLQDLTSIYKSKDVNSEMEATFYKRFGCACQKLKKSKRAKIAFKIHKEITKSIKFGIESSYNLRAMKASLFDNDQDDASVADCLDNNDPQYVKFLSSSVTYNDSVREGPHTAARKQILTGEVLMTEMPFASILLPQCHETHCLHCYKLSEAPYSCPRCVRVRFCSEECRQRGLKYHKIECGFLEIWEATRLSVDVLLALRMMTLAGFENCKKIHKRFIEPSKPYKETSDSMNENINTIETPKDQRENSHIYDDYEIVEVTPKITMSNSEDTTERTHLANERSQGENSLHNSNERTGADTEIESNLLNKKNYGEYVDIKPFKTNDNVTAELKVSPDDNKLVMQATTSKNLESEPEYSHKKAQIITKDGDILFEEIMKYARKIWNNKTIIVSDGDDNLSVVNNVEDENKITSESCATKTKDKSSCEDIKNKVTTTENPIVSNGDDNLSVRNNVVEENKITSESCVTKTKDKSPCEDIKNKGTTTENPIVSNGDDNLSVRKDVVEEKKITPESCVTKTKDKSLYKEIKNKVTNTENPIVSNGNDNLLVKSNVLEEKKITSESCAVNTKDESLYEDINNRVTTTENPKVSNGDDNISVKNNVTPKKLGKNKITSESCATKTKNKSLHEDIKNKVTTTENPIVSNGDCNLPVKNNVLNEYEITPESCVTKTKDKSLYEDIKNKVTTTENKIVSNGDDNSRVKSNVIEENNISPESCAKKKTKTDKLDYDRTTIVFNGDGTLSVNVNDEYKITSESCATKKRDKGVYVDIDYNRTMIVSNGACTFSVGNNVMDENKLPPESCATNMQDKGLYDVMENKVTTIETITACNIDSILPVNNNNITDGNKITYENCATKKRDLYVEMDHNRTKIVSYSDCTLSNKNNDMVENKLTPESCVTEKIDKDDVMENKLTSTTTITSNSDSKLPVKNSVSKENKITLESCGTKKKDNGFHSVSKNNVNMAEMTHMPEKYRAIYQNKYKGIFYFEKIYSLVSSIEYLNPEKYVRIVIIATLVYDYIRRLSFTPYKNQSTKADFKKDDLDMIELFIRNLLLVRFNGRPMFTSKYNSKTSIMEKTYYGYGIYANSSMTLHECYPNVARIYNGKQLQLLAMRPINPGAIVTDSYGPDFTDTSLEDRHKYLRKRYHLTCRCIACRSDWVAADVKEHCKYPTILCPHRSLPCKTGYVRFIPLAPKCPGCCRPTKRDVLIKNFELAITYEKLFKTGIKLAKNGKHNKAIKRICTTIDKFSVIARAPYNCLLEAEELLKQCLVQGLAKHNVLQQKMKKSSRSSRWKSWCFWKANSRHN